MYDIVIVDSGVNINHPFIKQKGVEGYTITCAEEVIVSELLDDRIGHGTSMYGIIRSHAPEAHILNLKLEGYNDRISEEQLYNVLMYIYENINCSFLNLSLGLRILNNTEKLYSVCSMLRNRGTLIIAAYDNEGCQTYPACFDCVIGVEHSDKLKNMNEYIWNDNCNVNVMANGSLQKVLWSTPNYVFLGGNSIACAHVTGILFSIFKNRDITDLNEKICYIKKCASKVNNYKSINNKRSLKEYFYPKNIALFPFNKEMHALVRFEDKIPVNIKAIYDIRQSGKVGINCSKFIGGNDINNCQLKILNINQISWKEIDTLVIGHCDQLNELLGYDIRKKLINEARENNVNIYCYDPLINYYSIEHLSEPKIYSPSITKNDIPIQQISKMDVISKPVVGIFGTSSRQGKFTLQCKLKYIFEEYGYKVGCIGTEPNCLLLGMDSCIPVGYNAYIDVNDQEYVQIVNNSVHNASLNNDLIIAAGQANSIPFINYSRDLIPVKQHPFILGLQPDIIILCVNPFDNYDYIKYTIKYLEGTGQCDVIGLVVYPQTYYPDWRSYHNSKKALTDIEKHDIQEKFSSKFKLPVYFLDNEEHIKELIDGIIEILS